MAVICLIIFALLSPAAIVGAAGFQEKGRAEADRLIAEAQRLRAQNTTDSLKQAIAKYEEAFSLLAGANDNQLKANLLNSAGLTCLGLGEMQRALDFHNRAIEFARAAADKQIESDTLKAIGNTYRVLGETYKALEYYNQAILLARSANDAGREAWLLNAMGLVYYSLGDYQKAIVTYNQSLLLAREKRYQGVEATALSHLGSAYDQLGDKQKALEALNQSVELSRIRRDRGSEAGALQSIGRVYHSMGEYQKAIDYLNQSLPLAVAARSRTSQARAHYNIGKAYTEIGEHEQALDHLGQALEVYKAAKDPSNTAAIIHVMARVERNKGDLNRSLDLIDDAIGIIEQMRANAFTKELRASYLGSVRKYYELKIEVLTRLDNLDPAKNHAAAALEVSEMARARSLLETLIEAGADIRQDVSPDLIERERATQQQLNEKAAEQARLLNDDNSKERLAEIEKQVEALTARYQEIQAEIRLISPRYAALMQPQPLSIADIQRQVLDPQTVLLEYFLGEERSYLWAATTDSIKVHELPKREEIEKIARRVYLALTARNRRMKFETAEKRAARFQQSDAEFAEASAELSLMVLAPVAEQIIGKRLLIVSDGALQYVPFAALPVPQGPAVKDQGKNNDTRRKDELRMRNSLIHPSLSRPLVAEHEIVVLPSASTLALLRREIAGRKPAPRAIAVLADPVFDKADERVKAALAKSKINEKVTTAQADSVAANLRSELERSAKESGWEEGALRLARLPFTRKEAQVIAALVPAAGRKEALDFQASRASAGSSELSYYRVVHFATHGFLNSAHPELSGMVLSLIDEQGREQDGFLRAHEIYNLKLPAELIVLSGCRTGLGKEIKGEGLVGLTRAFMHAGAARIMVSLWDINDEATAELVARFYRAMLGRKLTPTAALREAQVSMLKEKQWAAPYYWGAFVIQGEPK